MKVVDKNKTHTYKELILEHKFLFFKWNICYRMKNNTILVYKKPNNYKNLGFSEYLNMKLLFDYHF